MLKRRYSQCCESGAGSGLGIADPSLYLFTVLRIRIRRIRTFLGLPDLDPLVIDPDPDPSLFC
jgi:hypothetical protein